MTDYRRCVAGQNVASSFDDSSLSEASSIGHHTELRQPRTNSDQHVGFFRPSANKQPHSIAGLPETVQFRHLQSNDLYRLKRFTQLSFGKYRMVVYCGKDAKAALQQR